MITAILSKFEPLADGSITVTLKATSEQIQEIVNLYMKKEPVVILPVQTEMSADKTGLLKDILAHLEVIKTKLEKEL